MVVCGKNAQVKKELEERNWPDNVKPTILGFVDNMDEWMAAADCIVTKAGPGTIAEAATRGLPCLLSSHLPGQEAGNVKFVVEGGFGAFVKKPAKIGATIAQWFADLNLREKLSREGAGSRLGGSATKARHRAGHRRLALRGEGAAAQRAQIGVYQWRRFLLASMALGGGLIFGEPRVAGVKAGPFASKRLFLRARRRNHQQGAIHVAMRAKRKAALVKLRQAVERGLPCAAARGGRVD